MTSSPIWWQRLGAALSALVLALLTFGPGLDAILCRDDGGMSAAAAEAAAGHADHADVAQSEADLSGHGTDGVACVHGHCHHGASYVPAEVQAAAAVEAPRAQHELPRSRVVVSDPKFALKRPPRA